MYKKDPDLLDHWLRTSKLIPRDILEKIHCLYLNNIYTNYIMCCRNVYFILREDYNNLYSPLNIPNNTPNNLNIPNNTPKNLVNVVCKEFDQFLLVSPCCYFYKNIKGIFCVSEIKVPLCFIEFVFDKFNNKECTNKYDVGNVFTNRDGTEVCNVFTNRDGTEVCKGITKECTNEYDVGNVFTKKCTNRDGIEVCKGITNEDGNKEGTNVYNEVCTKDRTKFDKGGTGKHCQMTLNINVQQDNIFSFNNNDFIFKILSTVEEDVSRLMVQILEICEFDSDLISSCKKLIKCENLDGSNDSNNVNNDILNVSTVNNIYKDNMFNTYNNIFNTYNNMFNTYNNIFNTYNNNIFNTYKDNTYNNNTYKSNVIYFWITCSKCKNINIIMSRCIKCLYRFKREEINDAINSYFLYYLEKSLESNLVCDRCNLECERKLCSDCKCGGVFKQKVYSNELCRCIDLSRSEEDKCRMVNLLQLYKLI